MINDDKQKRFYSPQTKYLLQFDTRDHHTCFLSDMYLSERLSDVLLPASQVPVPLSSLSRRSVVTNLELAGTLIWRGRDSMLRCKPDSLG